MQRRVTADAVLPEQEVGRERHGGPQCCQYPDRVEAEPVPDLGDERQAAQRTSDAEPHPLEPLLAVDEAREGRDQDRRGELEQERDADRETVDRDEVEVLDERDPGDSEGSDHHPLTPGPGQMQPVPAQENHADQRDRGSRTSDGGERHRVDSRGQEYAGGAGVEDEQSGGERDEQIAAPGVTGGCHPPRLATSEGRTTSLDRPPAQRRRCGRGGPVRLRCTA